MTLLNPPAEFELAAYFKTKTALLCEGRFVVLPAGLEPATYCSASKRSNPLSYGSVFCAGGILLECMGKVKCLTELKHHSKIGFSRESPSGKASAFQADIRGFESHLPLCLAVSE